MIFRKYAHQIGGLVIPADSRSAARPNPSQVVTSGQSCTVAELLSKNGKRAARRKSWGRHDRMTYRKRREVAILEAHRQMSLDYVKIVPRDR